MVKTKMFETSLPLALTVQPVTDLEALYVPLGKRTNLHNNNFVYDLFFVIFHRCRLSGTVPQNNFRTGAYLFMHAVSTRILL